MWEVTNNVLVALVLVEGPTTAGEKERRPQDVTRSRHLVQVVFPNCPCRPVVHFLVEAGVSSHRVTVVQHLKLCRGRWNSVVKSFCGKLLVVQRLLLVLNEVRHCWVEGRRSHSLPVVHLFRCQSWTRQMIVVVTLSRRSAWLAWILDPDRHWLHLNHCCVLTCQPSNTVLTSFSVYNCYTLWCCHSIFVQIW